MITLTKTHQIEVDEEVYGFLKQHAEPFKDTPNSVLRRFLLQESEKIVIQNDDVMKVMITFPDSVPYALAQVLQMIILVKNEGFNRVQATHKVAEFRGITPQAVIDKYCRQLGKKAYEVDELLMTQNLNDFKSLLIEEFPYHKGIIESTFNELSV